jgi:hypothetical protein
MKTIKLYKVVSYLPTAGGGKSAITSEGFSSREAAERFAVGLASAGKAVEVTIEPYREDVTDEDD